MKLLRRNRKIRGQRKVVEILRKENLMLAEELTKQQRRADNLQRKLDHILSFRVEHAGFTRESPMRLCVQVDRRLGERAFMQAWELTLESMKREIINALK